MGLAGVLQGFDKTGALFLTFRLSTKRESYFVGRQADAVDIVLEHESVSRRHAELSVTPVGVLIRDLNAAHGTVVKGRRLKPYESMPLEDGAEIRFAGSSRRFRFRSPASVAADGAIDGGGGQAAWGSATVVPTATHDTAGMAAPPTSLFPPPPLNEALCKAVLYLLRNVKSDATSGYRLRPDGFAAVDALAKSSSLSTYQATFQAIDDLERAAIVNGQRLFERRDEGSRRLIRARTGHTPAVRVNPALQLCALSLSELGELGELVHATYFRCWNAIRSSGLDAMAPPSKRGVVCFGTELPARGSLLAGMREKAQVLVCVDAQAMLLEGLSFLRDADGAICCAGDDESGRIALRFATRVLNASNGAELLDRDELEAERQRLAGPDQIVGPAPKPIAPAQRAQPAADAHEAKAERSAPADRFNPYLAGGAREAPECSDDDDGDEAVAAPLRVRKKRARLGT